MSRCSVFAPFCHPPRNGNERLYLDVFRRIAWLQRTAGYAQTGRDGSEGLLAQALCEYELQLSLYGLAADQVNEFSRTLVMIPCDLCDAESLLSNTAPSLPETLRETAQSTTEVADLLAVMASPAPEPQYS